MNQNKKRQNNSFGFYAKYSALAFEMIIIIVAGAFGGRELDKLVKWDFPVFTLTLTLLAAVGAVIFGVRDLFKKNK